jgi:hypothetical protein
MYVQWFFTSDNVYKWYCLALITKNVCFNYNLNEDGDLSLWITRTGKKCSSQAFVEIPRRNFFVVGTRWGAIPGRKISVAIPNTSYRTKCKYRPGSVYGAFVTHISYIWNAVQNGLNKTIHVALWFVNRQIALQRFGEASMRALIIDLREASRRSRKCGKEGKLCVFLPGFSRPILLFLRSFHPPSNLLHRSMISQGQKWWQCREPPLLRTSWTPPHRSRRPLQGWPQRCGTGRGRLPLCWTKFGRRRSP